MQSIRSWRRLSGLSSRVVILFGLSAFAGGCGGIIGGEAEKTPAQLEKQKKVEELVTKGKSLREIRAIMKGEPLPTKKGSKKAVRKH